MVRTLFKGISYDGREYVELACLSTDTKPVDDYFTGSTLIEIDTSDVYFYDEVTETWVKAGGSNA